MTRGRANEILMQMHEKKDRGNYDEAYELAMSLDERFVKNTYDMIAIADICIKVGQYEDALKWLVEVRERSSSKRILVQLIYVCLKLNRMEEAHYYYDIFLQSDSDSTDRYILEYRIRKREGADYEELAKILERINQDTFSERWAFELAKVYHRMGNVDACVDECEKIILWFGSGPIVEKARTLRDYHLGKNQQESEESSGDAEQSGDYQESSGDAEQGDSYSESSAEMNQDDSYQETSGEGDDKYQGTEYQDAEYPESEYQEADYQEPQYQDLNYQEADNQEPQYQDSNYQEVDYQEEGDQEEYQEPAYQDAYDRDGMDEEYTENSDEVYGDQTAPDSYDYEGQDHPEPATGQEYQENADEQYQYDAEGTDQYYYEPEYTDGQSDEDAEYLDAQYEQGQFDIQSEDIADSEQSEISYDYEGTVLSKAEEGEGPAEQTYDDSDVQLYHDSQIAEEGTAVSYENEENEVEEGSVSYPGQETNTDVLAEEEYEEQVASEEQSEILVEDGQSEMPKEGEPETQEEEPKTEEETEIVEDESAEAPAEESEEAPAGEEPAEAPAEESEEVPADESEEALAEESEEVPAEESAEALAEESEEAQEEEFEEPVLSLYGVPCAAYFSGFETRPLLKGRLMNLCTQIEAGQVPRCFRIAGDPGETLHLAMDLLRFMRAAGCVRAAKVAKIQAEKCNRISLEHQQDALHGAVLLVTDAQLLNAATLEQISWLQDELRDEIFVILIGNQDLAGRAWQSVGFLL